MVKVSLEDLEFLNRLTESGDKSRRQLTSTILTLYGAVSSGLFLLVSKSPVKLGVIQKTFFMIVVLTAVLIVLLSLGEKLADYFAHVQVGQQHAKNIRENKTAKRQLLKPTSFVTFILKTIPLALVMLILLNTMSAAVFISLKVL